MCVCVYTHLHTHTYILSPWDPGGSLSMEKTLKLCGEHKNEPLLACGCDFAPTVNINLKFEAHQTAYSTIMPLFVFAHCDVLIQCLAIASLSEI